MCVYEVCLHVPEDVGHLVALGVQMMSSAS